MTKEIALLFGSQCVQEHKTYLQSSSKQERYPTADHIILVEAILRPKSFKNAWRSKGLHTKVFGILGQNAYTNKKKENSLYQISSKKNLLLLCVYSSI